MTKYKAKVKSLKMFFAYYCFCHMLMTITLSPLEIVQQTPGP